MCRVGSIRAHIRVWISDPGSLYSISRGQVHGLCFCRNCQNHVSGYLMVVLEVGWRPGAYLITTVKGLCKMTRSFDSVGYCFTFEWALWSFQAFPSPLASCCLGLNEVPVANLWLRNVESNVESPIQGVVLLEWSWGTEDRHRGESWT